MGNEHPQSYDRIAADKFVQLNIIQIISTAAAVLAILRFYTNLKSYMTEHKPLMKLMAFKLIVGLVFLEKVNCHDTVPPNASNL